VRLDAVVTDSALYFPYIEVPERPSLTRVLLYWDRLGTIAPPPVDPEEPQLLSKRMRQLVDSGLVETVEPDRYFRRMDGFAEGFLAILDARSPTDENRAPGPVARSDPELDAPGELVRREKFPPEEEFRVPPPSVPRIESVTDQLRSAIAMEARLYASERPDLGRGLVEKSRLHREKATPDLWAELIARGYAHEEHRGDEWLVVDRSVADLYMAYLALALGRLTDAEPVTDEETALAAIIGVRPTSPVGTIDRARSIVLTNALPAPEKPVAARELARFKEKNRDALLKFRLHAEMKILGCLGPSDPELQERCLRLAAQELEQEVAEIEALMARRRWPTARGLLCAALAGAPGAVKTAITGNPLDLTEVVSPLIAEVVGSFVGHRSDATRNPVAYAALAQRAF
jgi:hypothetical protein